VRARDTQVVTRHKLRPEPRGPFPDQVVTVRLVVQQSALLLKKAVFCFLKRLSMAVERRVGAPRIACARCRAPVRSGKRRLVPAYKIRPLVAIQTDSVRQTANLAVGTEAGVGDDLPRSRAPALREIPEKPRVLRSGELAEGGANRRIPFSVNNLREFPPSRSARCAQRPGQQ
jgi:hypothetical protein